MEMTKKREGRRERERGGKKGKEKEGGGNTLVELQTKLTYLLGVGKEERGEGRGEKGEKKGEKSNTRVRFNMKSHQPVGVKQERGRRREEREKRTRRRGEVERRR
jgi:hypothetical protein